MLNDIYHALDPIAFSIGAIHVRWYGLSYVLSFILCAIVAYFIAKRWRVRLNIDGLLTIMIAVVLGTLLGGRLGYVLFYDLGNYLANPGDILAFNKGGMSFHGGLIGFAIGAVIAAKINKMPIANLADIAGICAPIGLFLVRIANFINGELWGSATDLPWGVIFDRTGGGIISRHPTQLYEAVLEGLVLFALLYLLSRKRQPLKRGTYFGIFLIGYATFRIAVEFVRLPDAHIGYLYGTDRVTMGMMLCLPMILVGCGFLFYALKTRHLQENFAIGDEDAAGDTDDDGAVEDATGDKGEPDDESAANDKGDDDGDAEDATDEDVELQTADEPQALRNNNSDKNNDKDDSVSKID